MSALAVLAAACGGGAKPNQKAIQKIGAKYVNEAGTDVKPPVGPDTQSLALPGFLVATNSPSWHRLTAAPRTPGAVVLFIQPGGPTDNKGIAQGDVLTAVDGTPIANAERAIAVLHSRVGQKRVLTFARAGKNNTRQVTIIGRSPQGNPATIVGPELANNPTSPVLRYLRAYIGGPDAQRLDDLARALRAAPDFADALQLRASLQWASSFNQKDPNVRRQMQTAALAGWKNALDIDPRNETTLAVRSVAETTLGIPKSGEGDALRALNIDGSQPLALFALSQARAAENKLSEALGPALGAVDLQPYNLDYWKNLASLFVRNKRKDDCVKTANAFAPYLRARSGAAFQSAATDLLNTCK
jgi:hypothetical protein